MKMSEEYDKELLEGFFAEIKEKDKGLNIPHFAESKKPGSWILVPLGIAASLLLMFWLKADQEPTYTIEHDVVIITMEKGLDEELMFDIRTASSIDIWESPTSSLLTEY